MVEGSRGRDGALGVTSVLLSHLTVGQRKAEWLCFVDILVVVALESTMILDIDLGITLRGGLYVSTGSM